MVLCGSSGVLQALHIAVTPEMRGSVLPGGVLLFNCLFVLVAATAANTPAGAQEG